MKFNLSIVSVILISLFTLNGCSKDEKKVNDTNAATQVKEDESPPIGVWVSGDKKIVVTKEKFGECKWLSKPPKEGTPVEGCNNYYGGLTTKANIVEDINVFFASINESIKNSKEISKEEINLTLSELKKEESKTQGILNQIIDMPLKTIAGYESENDYCSSYYFIDSKNLYLYIDCSDLGRSIEAYSKQN